MYVASPVSAILYKCKVTKTDIPYDYRDDNLTITALMRIRLLKRYKPGKFTFDKLKNEYGIFELRCKFGSDITRTLYFFYEGATIVLTNGFVKKTQKTPLAEIQLAKDRRKDYLRRKENTK